MRLQATGKRAESVVSDTQQPATKALLLVGDIGFEKHKNAAEYIGSKQHKSSIGRFGEATVGFGNLAPLAALVEQQVKEQQQQQHQHQQESKPNK